MLPVAPVLGVLRAVPVWVWVVGAALAWGGWQRHRATSAAETLRQAQQQAAAVEAEALRTSITETERRLSAHQEIASAATVTAQANARAAASARAAADRLRRDAAAAASAAASSPAVAGDCTAANDAARVFAELLGRATDRAVELAAVADEARTAGAACERAYDSLNQGKSP
jgi:cytoskeletal protein RodZ